MKLRQTRLLDAAVPGQVAEAADCLREGGLVAFPTETVYGLGADATSGVAVARIYEAKGRPAFNPLIAHVPGLAQAQAYGKFSDSALALAGAFWPGPLTLVVPHKQGICALARAGLDSIGLRVPGSAIARQLLAQAGIPVAGPSANRSGHVSPVTAAHVLADLNGRIDMILDDGPCPVGVESTIIACLDGPPRLLRPGGIAVEAIEALLGSPLFIGIAADIIAPGQLASHYAPSAKLRLNAQHVEEGETGVDFGGCLRRKSPGAKILLDLSPRSDLAEAAANLFICLRLLDVSGIARAAIAPVPARGLGTAINDRLARAAAAPK